MEYRSALTRVRPPRFAVAYQQGSQWMLEARRVVANISAVWGGAGVPIPVDDHQHVHDGVLQLLRLHDPDLVALHQRLLDDVAAINPTARDAWIEQFKNPQETPEETWQRIRKDPALHYSMADTAAEIGAHCAPFKDLWPTLPRLSEDDLLWQQRVDGSSDQLPTVYPHMAQSTLTLDLSAVDTDIALMVESRIGAIDPVAKWARDVRELSVSVDDIPTLLNLAVTGNLRGASWDIDAMYRDAGGDELDILTDQAFLGRVPAQAGRTGTIEMRTSPAPPVVCVVGDSANDHTLAMLCDRAFSWGVWIPARLLAEESPHRTSTLLALRLLRHLHGAPAQPILLASSSEPIESLQALATEIDAFPSITTQFDGEPPQPAAHRRPFKAIGLSSLASQTSLKIITSDHPPRVERRPTAEVDDGIDLLTQMEPMLPSITSMLGEGAYWVTDVEIEGVHLPSRTEILSSNLTQSSQFPDTNCRTGRNGTSYLSPNFGFSFPGSRLARPMLRFPGAEQIFHNLAEAADVAIERSDAGTRAANAVSLWGSFREMAADLTGTTRKILDYFLPPAKKRDGDYGHGYAIRAEGFVSFEDIFDHAGIETAEIHELIDRFTALKILKRGFILSCERCRHEAFYVLGSVGSDFTCQNCEHVSQLTSGRWYSGDSEPHPYYRLDNVVKSLLSQHGDIPVLAVNQLAGANQSLLWCPEIILQGADFKSELDICSVIDGKIHVGEGKSNDKLQGDMTLADAAVKLVRAAQIMTADVIVLATSQDRWATGQRQAVETALDQQWASGPRPQVLEKVRVRNP